MERTRAALAVAALVAASPAVLASALAGSPAWRVAGALLATAEFAAADEGNAFFPYPNDVSSCLPV